MFYIVSENVQVVLNGQKYLLEVGDQIILESLDRASRSKLGDFMISTYGPVLSPEDYWNRLKETQDFLIKCIGQIRKKKPTPRVEQFIKDIKHFLNRDLDDFVMSLADPKVQEQINQDKIDRIKKTRDISEIEKAVGGVRRAKEQEFIDVFGETPQQAATRMRREREEKRKRQDNVFESIMTLSDF